jgi:hypothetical protein
MKTEKMKKALFTLLIFLFIIQNVKAQDVNSNPNFEELSKLEGLEYSGGITFYIEKKNENLVAIQNGIIKWKADVFKNCNKRKTKINSIFIKSGNLKVLFGKRNFALINIQNGSIECLVESKRKKIKKEKINFINNNN